MMENYNQKLDWLFHQLPMFSRVGAAAYKPGLDRSIALAHHFGNPQNAWKSVHIAGTNGKGSVSHLIASVLQSQGYKVGLYTSPHLVDFRERMRVNGRMIPKDRVEQFIDQWRRDESDYTDKPSFFELTMMMAFRWFADEKVDYAVIETGMGGRLDSTNIILPELSVITNISWDHAQFLGDTLPKIASEKAGIIKPGVPVVIGEAEGEIEKVFRDHAHETGSELTEAYNIINSEANAALERICPLHGDYQHKNINTARIAIERLREQGIEISPQAVSNGFRDVIRNTGLQGRWEVLAQSPLTICDTGHNEAGIRSNSAQLLRLIKQRREAAKQQSDSTTDKQRGDEEASLHAPILRMVIGFVADKDLDHILPLLPDDAVYYLTQAQLPRALAYDKLKERADALGMISTAYPSVMEAYAAALRDSSPADILFIGGSTFIVTDLLTHHTTATPQDRE